MNYLVLKGMHSLKCAAVTLLFLALAFAPSAFGQAVSGTITGVVTDPPNTTVAAATVTITAVVDCRVKQQPYPAIPINRSFDSPKRIGRVTRAYRLVAAQRDDRYSLHCLLAEEPTRQPSEYRKETVRGHL